jgi:hypothetical protein
MRLASVDLLIGAAARAKRLLDFYDKKRESFLLHPGGFADSAFFGTNFGILAVFLCDSHGHGYLPSIYFKSLLKFESYKYYNYISLMM